MTVTVTMLYGGLLSFWFLVLSWRVVQKRQAGINLGDGGDPDMLRRIRGHGNFSEYVPLVLLLMALLESGGLAKWVIHALGATLLVARLLHGVALSFTTNWLFGRFIGTLATFILLAVCGGLCILHALGVV
jgi:hypothetical protein